MRQIHPRLPVRLSTFVISLGLALVPATAMAMHYSAWQTAVPEVGINSPQADGCPIESPDGLELYIASNRGGGGDPNDIWVAQRDSIGGPWTTPTNLGAPVNATAADFCPTPLRGNRLLFVSTRASAEACGTAPAGDIYLARRNPHHGWETPTHLGCDADGTGPNFPGAEFGPSLVETAQGTFLYFSSNGYGGDQDIYVSRMRSDGSFGPAAVVEELSTAADDFMPNVRKDGLEIVLNSNRPGSTLNGAGLPSQDVYSATRASTADAWSTPINLGAAVNTAGNETRSSLSGDGRRLHFGRDGDIFVSERANVTGG
jgi:hypothetical protein